MGSGEEFPVLQNDLILRAAKGEYVDRSPIWIMRQAGRYLPEFQEVRKEHDFFKVCQTPSLACKVTLQPLERYNLDAAIIFSDILVIPQALGMTVEMKPTVGPVLPHPITVPNDISKLETPVDVKAKLGYVFEAITLTRKELKGRVPLIGFSGAPWTLMCYMIEGGGSKTMSKSKAWLYRHSEASHQLLQILTDVIVDYLVHQVEAGAQLLQIFESHADYLDIEIFSKFSLHYLREINVKVKENLKRKNIPLVPMIVFAKGGHYALKELSQIGYEVIGLDWTIDPITARNLVGKNITLQGNLDPCALYASKDELEKHVEIMLKKYGDQQRHIVNLGHGINPDVPVESVAVFVDAVHRISSQLIANNEQKQ